MASSAAPLICAVAVLLLLQQPWSSSMVLGACFDELSSACDVNKPDAVTTCCASLTNLITTDQSCVCLVLQRTKTQISTTSYQTFLGTCGFNADPCPGGSTSTDTAPTSPSGVPSSSSEEAPPTSSPDTPSTPEAPTTPSSDTPSTPSTGTKAPSTSSPGTSSTTPSEAKVISKNGAFHEKSLWSSGIVLAAAWTSLAFILHV